ncbi:MAG: guanosine monophosphate reductase [Halobacteriota archaeon]|nr:guanosine monophosphate reductase [Halobacteriota archaeon]
MTTALTFDDVCLQPYYNNVDSRTEPQLTTDLTQNHKVSSPLVASNMQTVISDELADVLISFGITPIFHRFTSHNQIQKWIIKYTKKCFISWGVNHLEDLFIIFRACEGLVPAGICFDVAHGHSLKMQIAIDQLKSSYPDLDIIAGNVCTGRAVHDLANWGADAIRVGIGCGAACSTRIVTGFGVPQFTAIRDCATVAAQRKIPIIADGGIRGTSDIIKALAAGASTVMLGKMFAATVESAAEKMGRIVRNNNGFDDCMYAKYKGQASSSFQREGLTPEGVEGWIPVTGSAGDLINSLHAGIKSGLTYGGARTIRELQDHAIFTRVTPAYGAESKPQL